MVDSLSKQVEKLASELQAAHERLDSLTAERLEVAQQLRCAIEQIEATGDIVRSVSRELRDVGKESVSASRPNQDLTHVAGYIKTPLLVVDQDLRIRGFSEGAAVMLHLDRACIGKRLEEVTNTRSLYQLLADDKHPIPLQNRAALPDGRHLYATRLNVDGTDDPLGDLMLLIDLREKESQSASKRNLS